MNKKLMLLLAVLALAFNFECYAEIGYVKSTFGDSEVGTKSATAFVPRDSGIANITDLSYDLDENLTTGTIDIDRAESEMAITSATASGSVLWFDNNPTLVSASEYVIFFDESVNTYYLYRCSATASTSITVYETLTAATTTSDKIYPCLPQIRRHAVNVVSASLGIANIWLPSDLPSALTINGNTTSCKISVSGYRLGN